MATQIIRVGFIGAGANTRLHHLPKLRAQRGVELAAVANRSRESGERVAKDFGIARVYDDWREVVRAPDLHAICIGTWPYMHCEMTLAALAAGKHVLCEARMAMNAAEGRRMLAASRKAPQLVALLVPAPLTLETDSTLQSLLADGYVGEVLAVELHASQGRFVDSDGPLHWRHQVSLSGHNILNMGIWYEAMMRWLGPARRVMAMTKIAAARRRDGGGIWQRIGDIKALIRPGRGRRGPAAGWLAVAGAERATQPASPIPQPGQPSTAIVRRRPRGSQEASCRGRVQRRDWDGLLMGGGGSAQVGGGRGRPRRVRRVEQAQVREDLAHHGRVLHRGDEPQPAATARAGEDIEIEHGAAGVLSSRGESHPSP
jgi:predicted dehydrogenase